jgi:thiol-disulfide isomerase/thioredoxin
VASRPASPPFRTALVLATSLLACETSPPKAGPDGVRATVSATGSATAAPTASPSAKRRARLELVAAADGDVATVVKAELARARADGRVLAVYVGATWCEPCERFHHAAERGELDAALAPVRLVVFDLDRDEARLKAAGYGTQYVPLFVVPDADGRGTQRRIAGSIKGPGAVDEITPRLEALFELGNKPG